MITAPHCLLAVNGSLLHLDVKQVMRLRFSEAREVPVFDPAFTAGVYVLHNPHTDLVKIGYSGRNMVSRWRSAESASGVELDPLMLWAVSEPYAVEQRLHQRFSEHRELGEWFQSGPVMTWISDFATAITWSDSPDSPLPERFFHEPISTGRDRGLMKNAENETAAEAHDRRVEKLIADVWHKLAREVGPRPTSAVYRWFSNNRQKLLKQARPRMIERGLLEIDGTMWHATDPGTGVRVTPPLHDILSSPPSPPHSPKGHIP